MVWSFNRVFKGYWVSGTMVCDVTTFVKIEGYFIETAPIANISAMSSCNRAASWAEDILMNSFMSSGKNR